MLVAFLLIMPLVQLSPTDQTALTILVIVSMVYAFLSNRAAGRWGWMRLAPIIQPINVLIVTLGFAILYDEVNLVWTFYFLIPLSAALVTKARWAYLDGILSAVGYLGVVYARGGLSENLGAHLMVASVLVTFALFGGMLGSVVRRQEQTLREKIEALQTLTAMQQQLIEENKHHAVEMATLHQIGHAVSNLQTLENVFELIYEQIRQAVPLDVFFICLKDESGKVSFPILYDGGKRYSQNQDTVPSESPLGQTLTTGIPRLINRTPTEIATSPVVYRTGDTSRPSASLIYTPLQSKTGIIGVLSVQSYQLNAYDDHYLTLVTGIAQQAAIAIENARLLEAERAQLVLAQTLQEIGKLLTAEMGLDQVLENIFDLLKRVVQYDSVSIQLLEADGTLNLIAGRGFEDIERAKQIARELSPYTISRKYQTWQTVVIPDTHNDPRWIPAAGSEYIRSWIGAPLIVKGKLMGLLNVDNRQPNAYTEKTAQTVQAFADQAAIAIENARLFAQAQRRADEFALLYETTRDLTQVHDVQTLLETIVARARAFLHSAGGGMYLYDATRQDLYAVVSTHPSIPVGTRLALGEGMAGRVAQTRQPLIVDDYKTWSGRSPKFEGAFISAIVQVPMLYRGELIGVLAVEEYENETHKYTEDDMRLLSLFAAQAAGIVHSARLYEAARQRAAELEAVRQATLSLTSSLDPAIVLQTIVTNVLRLNPDAHDTHIYLYDNERLTLGASRWADGRLNEEWAPPREDGLTYTVAREGKIIVVPEMRTHPLFVTAPRPFEGAIVGLPLKMGTRVVGVMNIAYAHPRSFTDDELSVLQLIGDQAAVAIVNSRLHHAVQESEQRYRSLVENIPIGVYRVTPGPQGEILMANPALLKMFGYASLEEMQTKPVAEFYMNPSERKDFSDRVLREGAVTSLEQHLKRKDGSSIWVSVNARAVYQDGQPVYFDCTSIDITARKMEELARAQAEQALERRSEELEGLLQTSNSISAHLDLETVLTTIAEQARDLLQATEATLFLFDEAANLLRPIVALGEYTAERLALSLHPGEGVVGWVAQHRQPANIPHTLHDRRVKHVPGTPEEDESILSVPLIHSEQLVGVILLNRIPATGFTPNELDLLVGMAAQASAAIMNARLFEETRRSALEQRIISEITRTLNSTLDVSQAFPTVVKGLRALVDCERISLALLDEQHYFTLQLQDAYHEELPVGTRMSMSTTAAAEDVLAGRVHLTADLATEADHSAEEILYRAGYRSRVCLPLSVGERTIGSLNLLSTRLDAYTPNQLPALLQIANALAIAWENMQLFQTELTRRQELAALYELSRQLADTTSVDAIADIVLRYAVQTIHVTFARLLLLEDDDFVVRAAHPIRDLDQNLSIGHRISLTESPFCQHVLTQNEPVVIAHSDPRLTPTECAELFLNLAETVCLVPLRTGKVSLGLLVLGEERGNDREPFTADKIRLAHSIGDQASSALHRAQLFSELENAYLQTVLALANAVDAKDSDTNVHSQRLAEQALLIGKTLGLDPQALEDLHYGAILHDIGKIGVPDAVLKKPGPLTPAEWMRMYQHPVIGAQIIEPLSRLAGAAAIVRHHHERYDGTGYPDGLAGNAIPVGARILAVVDAFGAIIDKRVYKEGQSVDYAIQELKRCAGTQFDPHIVQLFLRLIRGAQE